MHDLADDYDVYLAGGMKSGWQDYAIDRLTAAGLTCCDPRSHGLTDPEDYTQWDLEGVKRSRAVLAYLELTNPFGANMALECGYAHALQKPIFFVNEKEPRGWSMAHAIAADCEVSLREAIDKVIMLLGKN